MFTFVITLLTLRLYLLTLSPWEKSVSLKVDSIVSNGKTGIGLESLGHPCSITTLDKEKDLLAIPEICADRIITLYSASLFTGHQGMIKTYLTIRDKFFIPNLMHFLISFLKACHICQLARNDKLLLGNYRLE